jgi:macrolide transport system ATP-binding/permease protein
MIGIREDLRYAVRAITRNRGVAAAAILSLALGIGANTTIFTMLNAILLRPLPVEDPSQLVSVHTTDTRNPGLLLCSYPNYKDYRDRNQVFSSLLLYSALTVTMTGHGDPQLLMGQLVSGNYFSTLGVRPVVGRGFLPEEDAVQGARPVTVISHALWMRLYGGDPQITLRAITLNGRAYQIVGVAPPDFHGLNALYAADVWAPMMMYENLYPNVGWVNQRRALLFAVAGRLKPGVKLPQAEASLQVLARNLEWEYPRDNAGRRIRLTEASVDTMAAKTRATVSRAVSVLMIVSGLVLLIACANVANLLLARAAGRSKEIAVRLALGASRRQLVRQFLIESVLLGLLGGVAGLAVARWARDLLWSMKPPLFNHAGFALGLDTQVLAYTFAIALATGVVFGLAPALQATRTNLATDLKERAGRTSHVRGRIRIRPVLVSSQVAFSVVALVGAGLFLRSVWSASRIDPGFGATHLGIVAFNLAGQGYDEERGRQYQERALEAAASTPGVTAAALSKDAPMQVSAARTVMLDGQESGASTLGQATLTSVVGPGYFQTLEIPLLRGRDFSLLDTKTTPRVAIVNEAAAAHFWPGQEPLGRILHFFGDTMPAEVVGVARNSNYQAIGEEPQPLIYLSLVQYYFPTAVVYFHVSGDPAAGAAAVRNRLQPLDRNLLLQAESFEFTLHESLWAQRLSAGLLAVFGALALLLASVGIYGVISYSVSQRVREFGVRMALGASAGDVRTMVLAEGTRLVAAGVAIGTVAALAAARAVESMLFVVSAWDTATFLLVPAILMVVGIAACWVPAARVSALEPAKALRDE